jgi:predicted transcriptional regulator
MELDERKVKILKAIVSNYLETGEPVGSRTISKYTDLNLSSATIRNEMIWRTWVIYVSHIHLQEEFQRTKDIGSTLTAL